MKYHVLSTDYIKKLMKLGYIDEFYNFTEFTYNKSKFKMIDDDRWYYPFFKKHENEVYEGEKYTNETGARDYICETETCNLCFIDTVEFWDLILKEEKKKPDFEDIEL